MRNDNQSGQSFGARLHQASALTQSQRCDDARDATLTENNEVATYSGATRFVSIVFSETGVASVIAALTLR